ncbi:MAG: T9SS type A sorting domain-containing protein [Melioribacteraceae bacterium]|nr:T9SS type A sorting domain-containing protein [Melioribacteraceae bacterium]
MKKSYKAFLICMLFAGSIFAQITNTVTFNVDMTNLIAGGFNPAVDSIRIQGLVWDTFGVSLDASSSTILLPSTADPNIYSTTIILNCGTAVVGDSLRWKLFIWPSDKIQNGSWEGGFDGYDGRPYFVRENGAIVNLDPVVSNFAYIVTGLGPQNTWHIMADLTDIIGTGEGYFDPTVDVLSVDGFSWDGVGFIVSGSKKLLQNPLLPGVIFETTLVVELDTSKVIGDSLRWKFVASPSDRWSNSGYENGVGRYTVFQPEGSTVEIGAFKPDLVPNFKLQKESKILFQIDMNHNATSRFDSSAIPLGEIECMTIRGSHAVLGSWSGHWIQADTINPGVPALNDSGRDGDKVAGDNIWSKIVTFPAGAVGGQTSYKYGVYYPSCETICTDPGYYMDGFGSTGGDLTAPILERDVVYEIMDIWPNHNGLSSVRQIGDQLPTKFELSQNYPNPFNPSTVIKYAINKQANVNLSIYNVLGQKVIELVNSFQNAGTYEVNFNASSLSSGIYIYSLSNGSNLISKKMLLLK